MKALKRLAAHLPRGVQHQLKRALIERCHPVLIVEGDAPEVRALLTGYGYRSDHLPGSPNTVWTVPHTFS